jgi:hypothetical protein
MHLLVGTVCKPHTHRVSTNIAHDLQALAAGTLRLPSLQTGHSIHPGTGDDGLACNL